MTDERALLATIVADPSDDTVRLAYADCIEDRGNAARAAFIRLQIEAERLHPNSNARAALERQAEALFAEHWIDWWGEVCAAVGLPAAKPEWKPWLAQLARRAGLASPREEPYERSGFTVRRKSGRTIDGLRDATFRRGFPEAVAVERSLHIHPALESWVSVAPLADLHAPGGYFLVDGSHLAGVVSLTLNDCDHWDGISVLGKLNLNRLRELALWFTDSGNREVENFADELARGIAVPRMRQLERLSLRVATPRTAEIIANAPNLAGLQALHIDLSPRDEDLTARERLTTLARSPHLAGLRELSVGPVLDPDAIRAATHNPAWKGLRKLVIPNWRPLTHEAWAALFDEATLPVLEDLFVGFVDLERDMELLVRSPLLKQLRHFGLGALGFDRLSDADLSRLTGIVDPERIETFVLSPGSLAPRVDELRKRFGDRLRIP